MVAGVVAVGVITALLSGMALHQRIAFGQAVGERMAELNQGIAAYLRLYGEQIRRIDPTCGRISLAAFAAVPILPAQQCSLTVAGPAPATVANAYQPTVAELASLGLVRGSDALQLPHAIDEVKDGRTNAVSPARLAISIRCVDEALCGPDGDQKSGQNGSQDGTPAKPRAAVLESLIFNTQPYYPAGRPLPMGAGAQLSAATLAIGAHGLLAQLGGSAADSAMLIGMQGITMPNPVGGINAIGGTPGILAAYSSWTSAGDADGTSGGSGAGGGGACGPEGTATCRDGSAPPTARWDFNNQDLGNVRDLDVARNVSVAGNVGVAGTIDVGANAVVSGNGAFQGKLSSAQQVLAGPLTSDEKADFPSALQVGGAAYVRSDLTLGTRGGLSANLQLNSGNIGVVSGRLKLQSGYGDFSAGGIGYASDSRLGGIRLNVTRAPGQPCNVATENAAAGGGNLALYDDGKNTYVMVCRAGVWTKAKAG